MLRYKMISAAASSFLLIGALHAPAAFGQEAAEGQSAGVRIYNVQPHSEADAVAATYARSTVDRLNVRTGADLSSPVIRMIGKSDRYEILGEQGDWVHIRLTDKQDGWIFREYIELESVAPPKAEADAPKPEAERPDEPDAADLNQATVVHMDDITNLRSGPGIEYDVIGKAKPGDSYPILDTKGDWYVVSLPDNSKAHVASWVVQTDAASQHSNPASSLPNGIAPELYIYHTHNQESWSNVASLRAGTSVDDPKVNITLVGDRLAQQLQASGIPALAGDVNVAEKLKQQKLNFSESYTVSRQAVDKAIQTYPSLSYFFDIHRDADVPREKTTASVNGKSYARVLFVVGTAHAGYKENKAFAEALNKLLDKKYPGLSRGILTKSEHQGNGEYNQSVSPGSLLMEIGGTNNTLQESLNTAEALADVFAEYYRSVQTKP
ncbi:stage II sporulation protein P [Paenibacillus doosanensis]|uniref:stage II sporulation protein P n=1 Tax=Paenibacillus doosanensis TaxID=1229154 RepID=UPI00217F9210|nr:stage II sporulation protein P [Paenibacillus doosanensis]MCS7461550.1 stage II sporulation protein P [Paenibacillus doosanensis]